jgi:low density lipoprotein-related protein 2
MFWIDIGDKKAIYSSSMNGENIKIIVENSLDSPSGIAIDYFINNRIYWSDSKLKIIESINIDGTDRMKIIHSSMNHPISIDIFENYVYWVSKDLGTINKVDKLGRGTVTKIIGGLDLITDFKIYNRIKYPKIENSPCSIANCSHLCLLKDSLDYECSCPDNSKVIDDDLSICTAPIELELDNPLECLCYNCWCWYNNYGVHSKCVPGN